MPYIKSTRGFNATAAAYGVLRQCSYYHDDGALLIAEVLTAVPPDTAISAAEFATLRQQISDHNRAIVSPAAAKPADEQTLSAALTDAAVPEYAKAIIRRLGVQP